MQENSISQQEEKPQNEIHTIKWKSLLWMLLGWSLSWGLGWEIGLSIDSTIRNLLKNPYGFLFEDPFSIFYRSTIILGLIIGGLLGGTSAGASIALVLLKENAIKSISSFLLLTIGWGIGGSIGFLFYRLTDLTVGSSVCGLIGGIVMVLVLWKESILSNKFASIVIPLGLALGFIITWRISFEVSLVIYLVLSWLITGIIMAWMFLPQIKKEKQKQTVIWIISSWLIGGISSFIVWVIGYLAILPIAGPGDSPVLAGLLIIFLQLGLVVGIVTGSGITHVVLSRDKPITYMQILPRIGAGLLIIGLIAGIIVWAIININIRIFRFDRVFFFATQNLVSGIIGWGIMVWSLRKNATQK